MNGSCTRCNRDGYALSWIARAVLYLEKVEGTSSLRMAFGSRLQSATQLHRFGEVLLSGMASEELDDVARSTRWVAMTEHTVTDPQELMSTARRVRERGFALGREEIELRLLCVAVPIRDHASATCFGISSSGPPSRVEPNLRSYVRDIKATADAVSRRLTTRVRTLPEAAFGQP